MAQGFSAGSGERQELRALCSLRHSFCRAPRPPQATSPMKQQFPVACRLEAALPRVRAHVWYLAGPFPPLLYFSPTGDAPRGQGHGFSSFADPSLSSSFHRNTAPHLSRGADPTTDCLSTYCVPATVRGFILKLKNSR